MPMPASNKPSSSTGTFETYESSIEAWEEPHPGDRYPDPTRDVRADYKYLQHKEHKRRARRFKDGTVNKWNAVQASAPGVYKSFRNRARLMIDRTRRGESPLGDGTGTPDVEMGSTSNRQSWTSTFSDDGSDVTMEDFSGLPETHISLHNEALSIRNQGSAEFVDDIYGWDAELDQRDDSRVDNNPGRHDRISILRRRSQGPRRNASLLRRALGTRGAAER